MPQLQFWLPISLLAAACGSTPTESAPAAAHGGVLASDATLSLATLSQLSWFPSENQIVACFPTGPQLFGTCVPPDTVHAYCTSSLNAASPTATLWLGTFHVTAQELAGCLLETYGEEMSQSIRVEGDTVRVSATPPDLVFYLPRDGSAVALLGAGISPDSIGPTQPHRLPENRELVRLVERVARSNRPWMAANTDMTSGLAGFASAYAVAEFPRPENSAGVTRVTLGFVDESGATNARSRIEQRQFPDALVRIIGNATLRVEQHESELDIELSGLALADMN